MPRVQKGTKFRSSYADSNPLWVVRRRIRSGVFECEILNEPIEVDGKTYDSDWVGTVRTFTREHIETALAFAEWQRGLRTAHESFYDGLELGRVVHYHNAFGKFIRCEVVVAPAGERGLEEGEKCLRRLALVGEWNKYELEEDGYHIKTIKKGALFKPSSDCIYENPKAVSTRGHGDPAKKPALKLKEGAA